MTELATTSAITTTTIATRIRDRALAHPERVAMREKDFGIWQEITWQAYWDTVLTVAHALLALGVEPGDRVAVHAENRPEWLYADLATVAVRGTTMGLYPTNPASEVGYLLRHSGSKILIAEDQEQVDKALEATGGATGAATGAATGRTTGGATGGATGELPDLERIVYIEPRGIKGHYDDPRLMSWDELCELGARHRAEHPDAVGERMAAARPADVMVLVYTSGTTGPPKGAMLTVANVEFAVQTLVEGGGFTDPPPTHRDLILSYLPLCHVAERIFTVWFNAATGVQVNFAESIETVPANLREVQPTILFGVPRIWEKVLAGVEIRLGSASPVKRWTTRLWLRLADRLGDTLVRRGGRHSFATRLLYGIGWVFCFRALRERIGMRRVRYAASGAAPIAPEVLKFFMGIGVPMHEVYGMTENTAVATANRPGRVKLGTVGEAQPGCEVRVDDDTGEILTRHPGTFAGYWRDERATGRVVEPDGWLHTGDVGEWDGEHLRITGRMKEIIITAGGKNVAAPLIENELKVSPYIREAIVIGDRRAYLTALIGIELDTVGEWATRRRLAYTTYRDLSERDEVRALVQGVVDAVNADLARAEQLKDFRLLPKELDHEDGELTATQKVKRTAVERIFGDLIDDLYGRSPR